MFRSTKTTKVISKRSDGLMVVPALLAWVEGIRAGSMHSGGVPAPGRIDPGLARIASRRNTQVESLAARWGDYRHSIPAAINQARIDLETAQCDLNRCEAVLQEHRAEYKKTHRGLDPPSTEARGRNMSFWCIAGFLTLCELPLTSAAFAMMPIPDWERLLATFGASAVMIALSHEIGVSFARPAKSVGQRLFGWVLVVVLAVILAAMSAVRTQAIQERSKQPAKSTPEVRLQWPKKGGTIHA